MASPNTQKSFGVTSAFFGEPLSVLMLKFRPHCNRAATGRERTELSTLPGLRSSRAVLQLHTMDLGAFLLRMGLALILGAIMGLERQWHQRMAGTRTNALVSTASAAFAMIGLMLSGEGSA